MIKEYLLKQLEGRPYDGWISIQSVKAMIEKAPSWIPCKERMPEDGERVLASTLYGVIIAAHQPKEWEDGEEYTWVEWEQGCFSAYEDWEVKAWMPLPKYKGE